MRRTVGLLGMMLVLLLAGHTQVGAQTAKVVPKGRSSWPGIRIYIQVARPSGA